VIKDQAEIEALSEQNQVQPQVAVPVAAPQEAQA
jgi:hypothetical protein